MNFELPILCADDGESMGIWIFLAIKMIRTIQIFPE